MDSKNRRMERHGVVPHSQQDKQDDTDIQTTFAYTRKQSHLIALRSILRERIL